MQKTEEIYFSNVLEDELANILQGKMLEEKISAASFYDISQGINIIDLGYPFCACYILNRCIYRLSREYCEKMVTSLEDIQFEKGKCSLDEIRNAFWGEGSEMIQRGNFLLGEECLVKGQTVVKLKSRKITKRGLGIWETLHNYAVDFARGKTEYEKFYADYYDMEYYEREITDAKRIFIDGVKNVILLEEELRGKDIGEGQEEGLYEKSVVIIESENAISQGTAFHIGGWRFLTCYHVVYDEEKSKVADDLVIYLSSDIGKKYSAIVDEIVKEIDLAFVKVENWNQDESFLLDMEAEIKRMDHVLVMGFPNYKYGDTLRIVEACVASTRQYAGQTLYGLDHVIFTGNSGGPILSTGPKKVIGIAVRGTKNNNTAMDDDFSGFLPIAAIRHLDTIANKGK